MHRIIKAHLDSFVKNNSVESDDESVQFEKFANFCILTNAFSGGFDIDDVTTGPGDDGVDGIAIIVDEEHVMSAEDARKIFISPRRNRVVDIIFIQSKRSESFDLGDFLKFKESILRFATQTPYACPDDIMANAREIFDVIIESVPKIRDGKPNIIARFVATGSYLAPQPLETAREDFKGQLVALGLFSEIDVKYVDRDELTKLWVNTYSGISASLNAVSTAPLPEIHGIDEAYLLVARAKYFVDSLLTNEDGNLRTQVFEENVRSFLGDDNPVNQSIAETINSPTASRFPVLNNGITIVSPDVRMQGSILHLTNFQIVNGCQTSNVLFKNRHNIADIMVTLKVVETQNEDVFSELVKATNSQSKVDDSQFLSLKPVIRRVETYFSTFDEDTRLYFERRDRQYVGLDIPAIRIYSLHNATKCVAAMFCNRPELSSRYPKAMYEELTATIFNDDTKEAIFYAACLTMYRFMLLVSNGTLPQNSKKFKWHVLPLVRSLIVGKTVPRLNSNEIERQSTKIIQTVGQHNSKTTEIFLESVRKVYTPEQSFRTISRIDARRINAKAFRVRFSKSLASLRHLPSQAKVRSTTHRRGMTSKPCA
jgi:hypothetical protein